VQAFITSDTPLFYYFSRRLPPILARILMNFIDRPAADSLHPSAQFFFAAVRRISPADIPDVAAADSQFLTGR
jgi:hypothetical protein